MLTRFKITKSIIFILYKNILMVLLLYFHILFLKMINLTTLKRILLF